MIESTQHETKFEDPKINIRQRLSGLWVAAFFCYIYADILAFYDDYLLGEILNGNLGPIGPITQELKLGIGVFMSIPAIMVYVSLAAKPRICRWINTASGGLFTAVSLVTTIMSPFYYYIYFGILEVAITAYIVWLVWKWPTQLSTN